MHSKKFLQQEAQDLHVTVHVGKDGLTENILAEVDAQLTNRQLIKVKFLEAARDKEGKQELVDTLVTTTGAVLVDNKGFTCTLYRSKKDSKARRLQEQSE